MNHQEKVERMYRHMQALGVLKGSAAPPVWRLLWRLGVEVKPPLFMSFLANALVMGTFFAVLWGVLMWFIMWAKQGMPVAMMLAAAVFAGLLFGVTMAAYLRHVARKHRLPAWEQYTGSV